MNVFIRLRPRKKISLHIERSEEFRFFSACGFFRPSPKKSFLPLKMKTQTEARQLTPPLPISIFLKNTLLVERSRGKQTLGGSLSFSNEHTASCAKPAHLP